MLFLVGLVQAGTPFSDSISDPVLENVSLQLRWDHQFQFAGYYAAKWNGYYKDAGFDVDIRSAITSDQKILSTVQEVAEGSADYGVGAADILIARNRGIPLVVLASVFQKSPAAFYALNGTNLEEPSDLLDLRVARNVDDLIDVEFQVMCVSEGIDPKKITPYTHVPGIGHLVSGLVDVIPGYQISAPFEFNQQGIGFVTLQPISYGIDFYGDSLFTSSRMIERDPDAVERFTRASLKGWDYALSHPVEIADRISSECVRRSPIPNGTFSKFNRFQIAGVRNLTLYPVTEVGHINPDRWHRMNELMQESGVITPDSDTRDLIFDPFRQAQEKKERFDQILITGVLILIFTLIIVFGWTLLLHRVVREKTHDLSLVNQRLDHDYALLQNAEFDLKKLHYELEIKHNELMASYSLVSLQKEKIQASEERYRKIIANTPAGYFQLDCEGRYLMVNSSWLSMHGYSSPDEVIGEHYSITQNLVDYKKGHDIVHQILQGETIATGEISRRLKDGSVRYHTYSIGPVMREGKISGIEGFIIDITPRIDAEDALRESHKKLKFLTGLTRHDIYNLLSAIQLLLDLAVNANERKKSYEYLFRAMEACQRIEAIIEFTREYENFGTVSRGWEPLKDIIESAMTEISFGIVTVLNEISPKLELFCDPIIRKVFSTLMENAIRHGGSISVIRFFTQRRDGSLIIICEDDGIGVRDEEKELIFHLEYGRNTGIGLYILREILDLNNFSICECGQPGFGARFEITVGEGLFRMNS